MRNTSDSDARNGQESVLAPEAAPEPIRVARTQDLAALVAIEEACFASDRLSRRSFRHLLTEGNSVTLVDAPGAHLRGYLTLLFRAYVPLARVYSIATAPGCGGRGVAAGLLTAAEALALARGCVAMRLEIRKDNLASQRLFLGRGYAVFGEHAAYYEDGMDALRLEKWLVERIARHHPSPTKAAAVIDHPSVTADQPARPVHPI